MAAAAREAAEAAREPPGGSCSAPAAEPMRPAVTPSRSHRDDRVGRSLSQTLSPARAPCPGRPRGDKVTGGLASTHRGGYGQRSRWGSETGESRAATLRSPQVGQPQRGRADSPKAASSGSRGRRKRHGAAAGGRRRHCQRRQRRLTAEARPRGQRRRGMRQSDVRQGGLPMSVLTDRRPVVRISFSTRKGRSELHG